MWLFVILLLQESQAQRTSPPIDSTYFKVKILKLNLLSPIIELFGAAFEVSTGRETSLQCAALIGQGGFIVTPEFRYYLSSTPAPHGTFIAPFASYAQADYESALGVGLTVGYQGFFKKRITIDAFFGPAYWSGTLGDTDGGFLVRGGLFIGVNLKRPPQ